MPACKNNNLFPLLQIMLKALYLISLACISIPAFAKTIDIKSTHAYTENQTYYLDATFNIELTEEAQKALRHGIALEIHTQFQLQLERKWLWNKQVHEVLLIHRIEHFPLTGDYLTIDLRTGLRSSFNNLNAALNNISSISKMTLFNSNILAQEKNYIGRIRTYIDLESLPPPMRPQVYFSNSWDIKSEWYEWNIIK